MDAHLRSHRDDVGRLVYQLYYPDKDGTQELFRQHLINPQAGDVGKRTAVYYGFQRTHAGALVAQAAREQTIGPASCRPVDINQQAHGARCVKVMRLGCEIGRGRYIEQGGTRIWLFHKKTNGISSVALEGSSVEDVNSEEAPATAPLACAGRVDGGDAHLLAPAAPADPLPPRFPRS